MMRLALMVLGLAFMGGLVAMLWRHGHYLTLRRRAVHDRQEMIHARETFHVLTFLTVKSGADVMAAVRDFRTATSGGGDGRWIYAVGQVFQSPRRRHRVSGSSARLRLPFWRLRR